MQVQVGVLRKMQTGMSVDEMVHKQNHASVVS